MKDYEQTFEDFWREIVCDKNGKLNLDQIKRELHDYQTVMQEVRKVYDHITAGKFSKPNTSAQHVIDAVADLRRREKDEIVAHIREFADAEKIAEAIESEF